VTFAQIDQTWGRTQAMPRPMVAVDQGRWRLIHRAERGQYSELYEKREDPREQRNLAGERPEVYEALSEQAGAYLEGPPPPWGEKTPTVELDQMQMNQLRALGYGVR
jgi:hypothetical protein